MSRGRVPNVNASLIHEARMLFQHFLGGRQLSHQFVRPAKAVCTHQTMKCAFCPGHTDAVVVINGYSACLMHESKARATQITVNVKNPSQV